MLDVEHERRELLDAVKNAAYLIEQTADPAQIVEYIDQLDEWKSRLIALRPSKRAAEKTQPTCFLSIRHDSC